jgi:TolA-binding protein
MESELDQQRDLSRDLSDQLRRQQDRTEDLKGQLEQQQRQTEDLKSQLEKQERNTEILINQIHEQQRLLERLSDQPVPAPMPIDALTEPRTDHTSIQTIITGAVGIVVLIVVAGGGLILFAIIVVVLLSSRRRPARTIHIVHPAANPYTAFPPQPLLPARARTRQARHIDVEYYADGNYD